MTAASPPSAGQGWRPRSVRVRVPATSANLGPGFDSLGLALSLYDDVTVTVTGGGLSIDVTGEGREVADRGERHLIVKVLRRAFEVIDERSGLRPGRPPGLKLSCVNRIPHSRGLGSSSAAIIAGLLAARHLHPGGEVLDDDLVLALATEIEGHPDNVAPCLAGGLTIAWSGESGPRLVRLDVAAGRTEVVAYVPDQRLDTEQARGLLPATVPHADAAANAARAALLVAALTAAPDIPGGSAKGGPVPGVSGDEVLLAATEDRLHQGYRAPAMPGSAELVRRLREAGVAAVISGAGPTVLALTGASNADSSGVEVGTGWHIYPLNVDLRGAFAELDGT